MTPTARNRRPGLFEEILRAEDRDQEFALRPVLSFRDDDDPAFLDEVDRRTRSRVPVSRRGVWHGQWAELAEQPQARPGAAQAGKRWGRRWHAARPITLRVLDAASLEGYRAELDTALDRARDLGTPGGLRAILRKHARNLRPEFETRARPAPLADPERDVERVMLRWRPSGAQPGQGSRRRGKSVNNLWIKTGWLSTHDDDRSMRMRFSFGREGPDDANGDGLRHGLTAELARRILPELQLIEESELPAALSLLCGEPIAFSQHIAYWNAPEGGSLFHHDAFDEDPLGRQLGVAYVQLVGRTAWLALSLEDLAARVAEFFTFLDEGELPWVRAQLYPARGEFERELKRAREPGALARELALPACGRLSALVNRGPEFTAFLLDAGHGLLLEPGEALLLPNQGLRATAMHSVFCASESLTYGLSLAVRGTRPQREFEPPPSPAAD